MSCPLRDLTGTKGTGSSHRGRIHRCANGQFLVSRVIKWREYWICRSVDRACGMV
jgi:hypothetical protein